LTNLQIFSNIHAQLIEFGGEKKHKAWKQRPPKFIKVENFQSFHKSKHRLAFRELPKSPKVGSRFMESKAEQKVLLRHLTNILLRTLTKRGDEKKSYLGTKFFS